MLLFQEEVLAGHSPGEKTQTVRLWKHRRMRPGQRSYIPGPAISRSIRSISVELDELTDEDARRDGSASMRLLRREITQLYEDQLTAGYRAYRVIFHTVEKDAAVRSATAEEASERESLNAECVEAIMSLRGAAVPAALCSRHLHPSPSGRG